MCIPCGNGKEFGSSWLFGEKLNLVLSQYRLYIIHYQYETDFTLTKTKKIGVAKNKQEREKRRTNTDNRPVIQANT